MYISNKTENIIGFLERYPVFSARAIEAVLELPGRTIRLNRSRNITEGNADRIIEYLSSIEFTKVSMNARIVSKPVEVNGGVEYEVELSEVIPENFVELDIKEADFFFIDNGLNRNKTMEPCNGIGRGIGERRYDHPLIDGYDPPVTLRVDGSIVLCDDKRWRPEEIYILFYKK